MSLAWFRYPKMQCFEVWLILEVGVAFVCIVQWPHSSGFVFLFKYDYQQKELGNSNLPKGIGYFLFIISVIGNTL